MIDFIFENNEFQQIFLNEIRSIIDLMNEILYRPPYTILFGRINIEKSTTNSENHIKDINEINKKIMFLHFILNSFRSI